MNRLRLPREVLSVRFGRLTAALAMVTGAARIMLEGRPSGPFGHAVIAAFLLAAPALAIASLLPNVNGAVALIVGAAGAVSINALVAQSMVSANAWSPRGGVVAVGVIAALIWLVPGHPRTSVGGATKRGVE